MFQSIYCQLLSIPKKISCLSDMGFLIAIDHGAEITENRSVYGGGIEVVLNNNNYETLIKREPLVYTRARRAVQKKKKKKKKRNGEKKDSTTAITS